MVLFAHQEILELHAATIDCGLAGARDTLLGGVDRHLAASLPTATNPCAQVVSDLMTLNRARLADGSHALQAWLATAIALASTRVEAGVFRRALSTLEKAAEATDRGKEPIAGGVERGNAVRSGSADPLLDGRVGYFVGRAHVFAAIDSFLSSQRSGYFILEGESGAGKSALLSEYVRRTGCPAHFNDFSRGTARVARFINAIGAQLHSHFGVPPISTGGPDDRTSTLLELVTNAVQRLPYGERLVIVVDALDEVNRMDHPQGANTLHLPPSLPERAYFIVSRSTAAAPLFVETPVRIFDIMRYEEENSRDARAYLGAAIMHPQIRSWVSARPLSDDVFVRMLAERSRGNFMYLRSVINGISQGFYADRDLDNLPRDLGAYYEERWVGAAAQTAVAPREQEVIAFVLSEARLPLSPSRIAELTGLDEASINRLLDVWGHLLRADCSLEPVRYGIAHASFREFLYWKDSVQAAGVELAGSRGTLDEALNTLLGTS